MKTSWLPEMPVNVATILLDPHVAPLSDAKIGRLFRVLSRAWIVGEPTEIPADIRPAVESLWPQYAELREQLHQKHRALSEAGKRGGRPKIEREALRPKKSQALSQAESTHTHTQEVESPTDSLPRKRGADTWLTPYGKAWEEVTKGTFHYQKAAKFLSPLHEKYGADKTLRALLRYLAETPVDRASLARFAETFGAWSGDSPSPPPRVLDTSRRNSIVPEAVHARQNIPSAEETKARLKAEDEERRRQELRMQVRQVAS